MGEDAVSTLPCVPENSSGACSWTGAQKDFRVTLGCTGDIIGGSQAEAPPRPSQASSCPRPLADPPPSDCSSLLPPACAFAAPCGGLIFSPAAGQPSVWPESSFVPFLLKCVSPPACYEPLQGAGAFHPVHTTPCPGDLWRWCSLQTGLGNGRMTEQPHHVTQEAPAPSPLAGATFEVHLLGIIFLDT